MKSGVVYYANNSNGDFSIALKYEVGSALEFCKAAQSCGVFATVTPVGNVRVFTHRQVSRLLSNKPAVLTVTANSGKVLVQVWTVTMFEKEHTVAESLVGIILGDAKNLKTNDRKIYYYTVKAQDNDNVFFLVRNGMLTRRFFHKEGQILFYDNEKVTKMPSVIPAGSLARLTEENDTLSLELLPGSLNDYLQYLNMTTLITMFFKMIGTTGSMGDMLTISLAKTMFSKNDIIKTGLSMLLENMGYLYDVKSKSSAILYPIGYEEDAAVVHKNDILTFQLEKKEMILSIVNWDEQESEQ